MATEHIELCQLRNTWFPRIARRARYCVCMPSSCATWSSLSKRSFSFRNNFQFPTPKSSEIKTRNKDLDYNLNKVPTAPPLISHVSILATCCIMPWARKRLEQLQIAFCLLKVPPFRLKFYNSGICETEIVRSNRKGFAPSALLRKRELKTWLDDNWI